MQSHEFLANVHVAACQTISSRTDLLLVISLHEIIDLKIRAIIFLRYHGYRLTLTTEVADLIALWSKLYMGN